METALFELNAPDMFIYSANSIPPILSSSSNVSDIWRSVNKVIDQKSADVVTFFQDTATGDPASTYLLPSLPKTAALFTLAHWN
jgi:hypothetical protein